MPGWVSEHIQRFAIVVRAVVQESGPEFFGALPLTPQFLHVGHAAPVAGVLGPLLEAGVVATCGVIEFEFGWATRSSAEFDQLRADRDVGYEWLATHDEDWRRAIEVQAALWRTRRMRSAGLPDLLIAAEPLAIAITP
jgi:hypothetical protein